MKTGGGLITCVALLVALLLIFMSTATIFPSGSVVFQPFRAVLWGHRLLDLVGQLLMVMAGTFGVLVLVKERMEQ